jgi:hypothetical protein
MSLVTVVTPAASLNTPVISYDARFCVTNILYPLFLFLFVLGYFLGIYAPYKRNAQ